MAILSWLYFACRTGGQYFYVLSCYSEMPKDVLVIHAALGEEMVHPIIEQEPGTGRKRISRGEPPGAVCSSQLSPTRQGFPSPSLRVATDFRYRTVLRYVMLWFNEVYMTSDVPEDKDLETPLVVTCVCKWMEPLG